MCGDIVLDIPPDPLCIAQYGQGELSTRAHGLKLGFVMHGCGAHDPWSFASQRCSLSHMSPLSCILLYAFGGTTGPADSDRTHIPSTGSIFQRLWALPQRSKSEYEEYYKTAGPAALAPPAPPDLISYSTWLELVLRLRDHMKPSALV